MFVITDGKRNDIGTTMEAYAAAHLGTVLVEDELCVPFGGDALTVNGYLGSDGIKPLLSICKAEDKGIFVLVKTSNPSSGELQNRVLDDQKTLYATMGRSASSGAKNSPASMAIRALARSSVRRTRSSCVSCARPCRTPSSWCPAMGRRAAAPRMWPRPLTPTAAVQS